MSPTPPSHGSSLPRRWWVLSRGRSANLFPSNWMQHILTLGRCGLSTALSRPSPAGRLHSCGRERGAACSREGRWRLRPLIAANRPSSCTAAIPCRALRFHLTYLLAIAGLVPLMCRPFHKAVAALYVSSGFFFRCSRSSLRAVGFIPSCSRPFSTRLCVFLLVTLLVFDVTLSIPLLVSRLVIRLSLWRLTPRFPPCAPSCGVSFFIEIVPSCV